RAAHCRGAQARPTGVYPRAYVLCRASSLFGYFPISRRRTHGAAETSANCRICPTRVHGPPSAGACRARRAPAKWPTQGVPVAAIRARVLQAQGRDRPALAGVPRSGEGGIRTRDGVLIPILA